MLSKNAASQKNQDNEDFEGAAIGIADQLDIKVDHLMETYENLTKAVKELLLGTCAKDKEIVKLKKQNQELTKELEDSKLIVEQFMQKNEKLEPRKKRT